MIHLDTIKTEDLDILREWRNSENVRPYCRQYKLLTDADMLRWYNSFSSSDDMVMFGIKDLSTKALKDKELLSILLGACGIIRIDWRNRKGEISFYIGSSSYCTEENIKEGLSLLKKYAFDILNLHKVYFPVYSFNPYLRLYEKVLRREYVAKSEYYWQGKHYDRVILTAYD